MIKELKEFLDRHEAKYVMISHSPAFTAQEIAALAHIPGKDMAKTVMVKVDGKMTMAVLPASYHINLNQLREAMKVKKIELANESEFRDLFPHCEVGAMPPFGALYGLDMVVAKSLSADENIAFNAGSHKEVLKMAFNDYAKVAKPRILDF